MNERVRKELAEIKKGIKKRCPNCGKTYTCSDEFHAAICEVVNLDEE